MRIRRLLPFAMLGAVLTSATIDLDNLFNYADQHLPAHIPAGAEMPDSAPADNPMDDAVATLGRVLFHDKRLSVDKTVACANCHRQQHAFAVIGPFGAGVNGLTPRKPTRLVNLHATMEGMGLFWDERTASLEELVLEPIQDHVEMGYTGQDGAPGLPDLLTVLGNTPHYQPLFTAAYGDAQVTADRVARALAQFVRSIRSYDSRFDEGLIAAGNDIEADFPNYTAEENAGKALFVTDPWVMEFERIGGGAGCHRCHGTAPRTLNFVVVEERGNNGIITERDGSEVLDITRAPSLRDLFAPDGQLHAPLFHNGQSTTVADIMAHYDSIPPNPQLDLRQHLLRTRMHFTAEEVQQMEAFLRTLTGTALYTDPKWSDPFDADGQVEVIGGSTGMAPRLAGDGIRLFPVPASDRLFIEGLRPGSHAATIHDRQGRPLLTTRVQQQDAIDITTLPTGVHLLVVDGRRRTFIKH